MWDVPRLRNDVCASILFKRKFAPFSQQLIAIIKFLSNKKLKNVQAFIKAGDLHFYL